LRDQTLRRGAALGKSIGGLLDPEALARLTGRSSASVPTCQCGGHGELRRCLSNGGVAWQCRSCSTTLSPWLPHRDLAGIEISGLPPWQSDSGLHRDARQRDLFGESL
jgi:hypothetical protein